MASGVCNEVLCFNFTLAHRCRGHLKVDLEQEVELVKVNLMARQNKSPAYKSKQVNSTSTNP